MSDAIPAAAKAEPVTPDPAPKPKPTPPKPKAPPPKAAATPATPATTASTGDRLPDSPSPGSLSESAARSIDRLWGFTD